MGITKSSPDNDQDQEVGITGRTGLQADVFADGDGTNRLQTRSSVVPESLGDLFFIQASNGGSVEMAVNGAGASVTFRVDAETGVNAKDLIIREMRFHGFDNGIKTTNFMGLNSALSNGIQVNIISDGITTTFLPIKITADFDAHFAFGDGGKFEIIVSAGGDYVTATFSPRSPFILKKDTADHVEVIIQDNLSQVSTLELVTFGFKS